MKQIIQTLALCAFFALFQPLRAEESRRGFYEGTLAGNGRIVFVVQANESISIYAFDKAGQQVSFAGGPITTSATFSRARFGTAALA